MAFLVVELSPAVLSGGVSVAGITVPSVKQVVKVRVLPTDVQAAVLSETLHACNEAASWLSRQVLAARVHRKHDAQHRFYAASTMRSTASTPGCGNGLGWPPSRRSG